MRERGYVSIYLACRTERGGGGTRPLCILFNANLSLRVDIHTYIHAYMYERERESVCVYRKVVKYVTNQPAISCIYIHYTYYTYIYVCVCVCVYICIMYEYNAYIYIAS